MLDDFPDDAACGAGPRAAALLRAAAVVLAGARALGSARTRRRREARRRLRDRTSLLLHLAPGTAATTRSDSPHCDGTPALPPVRDSRPSSASTVSPSSCTDLTAVLRPSATPACDGYEHFTWTHPSSGTPRRHRASWYLMALDFARSVPGIAQVTLRTDDKKDLVHTFCNDETLTPHEKELAIAIPYEVWIDAVITLDRAQVATFADLDYEDLEMPLTADQAAME